MTNRNNNSSSHLPAVALSALLVITCIIIIILASVPPTSRDALVHHLAVPKLYLQHGGIYEIEELPFSYYPMNLDLLYMLPLAFGNDIAPKYIHFIFALGTAWLLYSFIKSRAGRKWGIFGALFFLTIPIIIKLAITVYVDLGLIFFSTASLLALVKWLDNDFSVPWLLLCGFCAGLAAGTKYNGLVTTAVIGLFIPFCYSRIASRQEKPPAMLSLRAVMMAAIFATTVLVTFSPWLIRNYVWTDNPIYPLYQDVFARLDTSDRTARQSEAVSKENNNRPVSKKSNIFIKRRLLYGETAFHTLTLPIRFFLQGQDDTPRYFDGVLSPFLLFLPAFAFMGWTCHSSTSKREILILLSFALLYFFFTFFQTAMRVRYISPSLPPLVILCTFGLRNISIFLFARLSRVSNAGAKALAVVIALAVLIPNYIYLMKLYPRIKPYDYLSGSLSRDDYIAMFRPEYHAITWLNRRTSQFDKVLCIFLGNRGYYMDFFPIFASPYDGPLPLDQINSDYVLVREDLFQAWLEYATNKNDADLTHFYYKPPLYSKSGYSVYNLN